MKRIAEMLEILVEVELLRLKVESSMWTSEHHTKELERLERKVGSR